MPTFLFRFWALFIAILGLGLAQAEVALASTFEVHPVRLSLSESSTSGLLTVRNVSLEPIRFQVSAHAWKQDRAGAVKLSPTQDIVFFPSMLIIKPGETRNIRVGTLHAFGPKEQSYRIFVEELPPLAATISNGIRVLSRFGIPVFLQPTTALSPAPQIRGLVMNGRTLSFAIENTGNAHFLTQSVRIQAKNQSGGVLLDHELPAWYILAGGGRDYEFDLPIPLCGASRLVVMMEAEKHPFRSEITVSPDACAQ
jgi:fimbrial chaperone protein